VPPDDFFDEDWEEPSQTQETAITRPSVGAPVNGPQPATDAPRPTQPRPPRRSRLPGGVRLGGSGGGPRTPRRPGGPGGPQLEYGRLAVLAVGILVLVVIAYEVFKGSSSSNPTQAYLTKVSGVLTKSDQVGTDFRKLLVKPTLTPDAAHKALEKEVTQSQALVAEAQAIKPTGQLAGVHPYLLQALTYRVNGLQCLAQNVVAAAQAKPRTGARELSRCAQRLLASDVIYADSYYQAASNTIRQDHLTGQVPTSRFLKESDTALVTAPGFVAVLSRLKPGSVSGVHGVELVSVTAEPSHKQLVTGHLNQIPNVNSTLGFRIVVKDSGKFQEVSVPVILTLKQGGSNPIVKQGTITAIQRGGSATIGLAGFFNATVKPLYGRTYTLTVLAGPVPGERNKSNNKATYTVTFLVAG
jgi:hypothetical protein